MMAFISNTLIKTSFHTAFGLREWRISAFMFICFILTGPLVTQAQTEGEFSSAGLVESTPNVSDSVDIYVYGYTFIPGNDTVEMRVPKVTITMRDLYGEAQRLESNDTAFYKLELAFDNKYQIFFEYDGHYTKFIELDTRDVIDVEKERGYLFPTDVGMEKTVSFDAAALLLKKPIGRAAFDRRTQTMNWDFSHTAKMRAEIDKLERKATKQKKRKNKHR